MDLSWGTCCEVKRFEARDSDQVDVGADGLVAHTAIVCEQNSPPREEGWTRHKQKVAKPPLMERTGRLVLLPIDRTLERTAPSAPGCGGFASFC